MWSEKLGRTVKLTKLRLKMSNMNHNDLVESMLAVRCDVSGRCWLVDMDWTVVASGPRVD
jgi:hypothetical protein